MEAENGEGGHEWRGSGVYKGIKLGRSGDIGREMKTFYNGKGING